MTTVVLYDLREQLYTPLYVNLEKLRKSYHSIVPIVPSALATCEDSEKSSSSELTGLI